MTETMEMKHVKCGFEQVSFSLSLQHPQIASRPSSDKARPIKLWLRDPPANCIAT